MEFFHIAASFKETAKKHALDYNRSARDLLELDPWNTIRVQPLIKQVKSCKGKYMIYYKKGIHDPIR